MSENIATCSGIQPFRAYRATEIADLVGVDVRTVRRALQTGALPRVRLDHWLRAWGADVTAWMAAIRAAEPTPSREDEVRERARAAARADASLRRPAA